MVGPKEVIINEKNGILFEVKNKEELIQNIKKLIEQEKFAKGLGEEAKKIQENLNPQKIVNQWERYICKVKENCEEGK